MYPTPSEQQTTVKPSPAATSVAGAGTGTLPGVALYVINSQINAHLNKYIGGYGIGPEGSNPTPRPVPHVYTVPFSVRATRKNINHIHLH